MSNSVAIVTGASECIGRATAIRLTRDFSALVLVARNRAHLDETAEAVKAGGRHQLVPLCDQQRPPAGEQIN
jgi:NAD(P)-dependent dehydrogenase (short-subunit alcohol dehydrogenase family)